MNLLNVIFFTYLFSIHIEYQSGGKIFRRKFTLLRIFSIAVILHFDLLYCNTEIFTFQLTSNQINVRLFIARHASLKNAFQIKIKLLMKFLDNYTYLSFFFTNNSSEYKYNERTKKKRKKKKC